MSRILVIEDNDQVRQLLRMTLEREGYDVDEAEDGRSGARLYRESPADVVITDIVMPEKEGLETITELRKDFPGAKIIAISGACDYAFAQVYLDAAKNLGASYAFQKPVPRDELLEAVKKLLDED